MTRTLSSSPSTLPCVPVAHACMAARLRANTTVTSASSPPQPLHPRRDVGTVRISALDDGHALRDVKRELAEPSEDARIALARRLDVAGGCLRAVLKFDDAVPEPGERILTIMEAAHPIPSIEPTTVKRTKSRRSSSPSMLPRAMHCAASVDLQMWTRWWRSGSPAVVDLFGGVWLRKHGHIVHIKYDRSSAFESSIRSHRLTTIAYRGSGGKAPFPDFERAAAVVHHDLKVVGRRREEHPLRLRRLHQRLNAGVMMMVCSRLCVLQDDSPYMARPSNSTTRHIMEGLTSLLDQLQERSELVMVLRGRPYASTSVFSRPSASRPSCLLTSALVPRTGLRLSGRTIWVGAASVRLRRMTGCCWRPDFSRVRHLLAQEETSLHVLPPGLR